MNYNSILIVTYGRSGSTLLQGILNSIDGCIIRGENYNFCYHLYHAYIALIDSKKHRGNLPRNPWYGNGYFNEKVFLTNCKNLLFTFLVGDTLDRKEIVCYGFKEIRYTIKDIEGNLNDYLDFLSKIFPNTAFIFNTRSINDVAKSEWWAEQDEHVVKSLLIETEKKFADFYNSHKNTFQITYEDVIHKTSKLKDLYLFIGAQYDDKKVDQILSIPHSYKSRKL